MLYDYASNDPANFVEPFSDEWNHRLFVGFGFSSGGWRVTTSYQGSRELYENDGYGVSASGIVGVTIYNDHVGDFGEAFVGAGVTAGYGESESRPMWTMNEPSMINNSESYENSFSYGRCLI